MDCRICATHCVMQVPDYYESKLPGAHRFGTSRQLRAQLWGVRKRRAREVLAIIVHYADVVLDSDATERSQPVNCIPINVVLGRRAAQVFQQHIDNIQAGLDGQHHVLLENSSETQERVATGWVDDGSGFAFHEAANVVHLNAEQVSQAVREECRRNASFQ